MQPIKIHFISLLSGDNWGGSEELWAKSAVRLLQEGHNVSACIRWNGRKGIHPRIGELQEKGAVVHEWNKPEELKPWRHRVVGRVNRKLFSVTNQEPNLWRLPNDAHLVVINSPGIGFSYPLIAHCIKLQIPYALICQSVSESDWLGDNELVEWQTTYRQAEAVYFVSKSNLECTSCQLAYRGQHFEVVHNPYKTSRSLAFKWPNNAELRKIAFVGRLQPEHKGIDLLLRSMSTVTWQKRPIQLNIYGDGRSAKQLREMVRYLNIERKVVFHGYVSDIDRVWDENEMLVLPSRHEGLPLAVIEALMRGRPCLVTDVSGNAEYITDSVNGFVAAGATLNSVASTLERAWKNRDLWETMGRNAFREIREQFPTDPIERFTAKLIDSCRHAAV